MANKFNLGDRVIVISLSKTSFTTYDMTLFRVGKILTRNTEYLVEFDSMDFPWDTWFYTEEQLIKYDDSMSIDTIKVLYGKK